MGDQFTFEQVCYSILYSRILYLLIMLCDVWYLVFMFNTDDADFLLFVYEVYLFNCYLANLKLKIPSLKDLMLIYYNYNLMVVYIFKVLPL